MLEGHWQALNISTMSTERMQFGMRQLIKKLISLTPYRIHRARDANRFQAIPECLAAISQRGFQPKVVIDGGANIGEFARLSRRTFGPQPQIHMFEPQPACRTFLKKLADQPGFHLHMAALGAVSGEHLELSVDAANNVTTGAHITPSGTGSSTVSVPVISLDAIFAETLERKDRALLKLDLQGWELEALKGAVKVLPQIEIVMLEASFFAQAYEPTISALVRFMDEAGFSLYDIASLAPRTRDNRPRQADLVFVNIRSDLASDTTWD
jgi:FkbM family methyltransferase